MSEEITIDKDGLAKAHQLYKQGHFSQAEKIYRDYLLFDRSCGDIYFRLGRICLLTQRNAEAIELLEQSLTLSPNDPATLFNIGNAFLNGNKLSDAEECYRKLLSLDPKHSEAIGKLAYILLQEGRIADSVQLYKQAIALNSRHTGYFHNLGCAFLAYNQPAEAIQAFKRVTELEPNNFQAFHHLATTLRGEGQLEAAIPIYEKALSISSNYADAHLGLSLALLLSGNYDRGWEEYEWRLNAIPGLICVPPFPKWDGQRKFHNGDLLILSEQGLGDTFQFIRYAYQLKPYFSRILVYTPKKLIDILSYSIDVDIISDRPTIASKRAAKWIPLLSIPRLLGVTQDTPIVSKPYINVPPNRLHYWQKLLPNDSFIVGINWQGNPEQEKRVSKGRSFPLSEFEVLSRIPGIKFVSLQKGAGSEQMDTCTFKHAFVDCQADVDRAWDFIETAAIVKNCHLIITSDTSLAHLAGALGQQTWILLKKLPDWRWGLTGSKTAWYPSVRLFRQQIAGDWQAVMNDVKQVLENSILADGSMEARELHLQLRNIEVPVSVGELIDKITILEIKLERLPSKQQKANVRTELTMLQEVLQSLGFTIDSSEIDDLRAVNTLLWNIEDRIRDLERQKRFDEDFIGNARSVYIHNDRRAAIKRRINELYSSKLLEEKSYINY